MAQKAASTQALQQEYIAQKMREQRKQEVAAAVSQNRGVLFAGLITVGLVVALAVAVGLGAGERGSSREGASKGATDATAHAGAGRHVLHFIEGAEVCSVVDRGPAWQKALRERFKVNIVRLRADAVPSGDWAGYYRAYNAEMVKAIVAAHGADVFDRASKPGTDH